jgi:hypothetical protein
LDPIQVNPMHWNGTQVPVAFPGANSPMGQWDLIP